MNPRAAHEEEGADFDKLLGAFGSHDMTLATPLDLLFLYECDKGDERFFVKLARRLATALFADQPGGALYAIDTAVETWGARGPIVSQAGPFFQFFKKALKTIHY